MDDKEWIPRGADAPGRWHKPGEAISHATDPMAHSDDPRAQRLAEWIESAPEDLGMTLAVHGGVLIGMALALSLDDPEELFDIACGKGVASESVYREVRKNTFEGAHRIIDG